jgi:hypothetical protein
MPHPNATAATDAAEPATHLSTPRTVRKRGIVWLGAALLAAVLQADL